MHPLKEKEEKTSDKPKLKDILQTLGKYSFKPSR
jgi:hypothetical protein